MNTNKLTNNIGDFNRSNQLTSHIEFDNYMFQKEFPLSKNLQHFLRQCSQDAKIDRFASMIVGSYDKDAALYLQNAVKGNKHGLETKIVNFDEVIKMIKKIDPDCKVGFRHMIAVLEYKLHGNQDIVQKFFSDGISYLLGQIDKFSEFDKVDLMIESEVKQNQQTEDIESGKNTVLIIPISESRINSLSQEEFEYFVRTSGQFLNQPKRRDEVTGSFHKLFIFPESAYNYYQKNIHPHDKVKTSRHFHAKHLTQGLSDN